MFTSCQTDNIQILNLASWVQYLKLLILLNPVGTKNCKLSEHSAQHKDCV